MKEIVDKYNVGYFSIPLENVFDIKAIEETIQLEKVVEGDETNVAKLKKLFASCSTATSREDLLQQLRLALLVHSAKSWGFEKVLTGETGTRLATRLIASTCKGRGFSLPEELAALDKRFGGVGILRPLGDTLSKEIAVFNHHNRLDTVFMPAISTKAGPKFSIDHLSESKNRLLLAKPKGFIEGLQGGFGHTIHTLLRSGNKLTHPENLSDQHRCPLCSWYKDLHLTIVSFLQWILNE